MVYDLLNGYRAREIIFTNTLGAGSVCEQVGEGSHCLKGLLKEGRAK